MNKDKSKGDGSKTGRQEAERMIDAVAPTCHAAIRRAYIAENLPGSPGQQPRNDGNGRDADDSRS
jgi:hypothetical protein